MVHNTLKERYGNDKPVELADAELRLSRGARELMRCFGNMTMPILW